MKRVIEDGIAALGARPGPASDLAPRAIPVRRSALEAAVGHLNSGELADPSFSATVIAWQQKNGRHQLPWQNTRDAYRIWLSEIMLQQTQVAAVIPYYQRFLLRFPDVASLAAAPAEEVMAHWSGLGYYSRARNLHRCAQRVCHEHGGSFPDDPASLAELPGIGRSTAAAIAAFAYRKRAAILDGNVKRVFCRVFGIDGYPGERATEQALWQRAEALLPPPGTASGVATGIESYTQGLMDLGATLCMRGKPTCAVCPLAQRCIALASGRVQQLPARKPKKRIPERHTAMLIVIDRNQVLLQQRPDHGIWGGLLSLPEFEQTPASPDGAELAQASARERVQDGGQESGLSHAAMHLLAPFGSPDSCRWLPSFSHTFTHFKLHVRPCQVTLARRSDLAAQDAHVWYALDKVALAPLPAPVKKLLLKMRDEQQASPLPPLTLD